MAEAKQLRLFVALWPDEKVRSRLTDIQKQLKLAGFGRSIPPENLHMTMLFLGNVPYAKVEKIGETVQSLQVAPFVLTVNRVGYWRHNKVVWASSDTLNTNLDDLSKLIRRQLIEFVNEKRSFVPHVTLARNARRQVYRKIVPIKWYVDEFRLIQSKLTSEGARYSTLVRSSRATLINQDR